MIIKNVIGIGSLNVLISNFEIREDQHEYGMGMEKLSAPWWIPGVSELLRPILDQYIDTSINVGDTYFKHYLPYFPHADNNNVFDTINVLIPLQLSSPSEEQHFVVFDQATIDQVSFIIIRSVHFLDQTQLLRVVCQKTLVRICMIHT